VPVVLDLMQPALTVRAERDGEISGGVRPGSAARLFGSVLPFCRGDPSEPENTRGVALGKYSGD